MEYGSSERTPEVNIQATAERIVKKNPLRIFGRDVRAFLYVFFLGSRKINLWNILQGIPGGILKGNTATMSNETANDTFGGTPSETSV